MLCPGAQASPPAKTKYRGRRHLACGWFDTNHPKQFLLRKNRSRFRVLAPYFRTHIKNLLACSRRDYRRFLWKKAISNAKNTSSIAYVKNFS